MVNILTFLNQNSGAIQAIMIILLFIITGWYVIKTHQMTSIMKQDFDLRVQPAVSFGENPVITVKQNPDGSFARLTPWVRFIFPIKNVGQVPVYYDTEYVIYNGKKNKDNSKNSAVVLYPDQILGYTTEDFVLDPPLEPNDINPKIEAKIIFWSVSNENIKYYHKRVFEFDGLRKKYDIVEDDVGLVK